MMERSQREDRVTDTSAGIKEENGQGVRCGRSRVMEGGTTIKEKCEHYGYMIFFFKSKFMDLTMTVREFTFEIKSFLLGKTLSKTDNFGSWSHGYLVIWLFQALKKSN